MSLPVNYISNFIKYPDASFFKLRSELEWERRDDAPRSEYFCSDFEQPYTYGRGRGERTYYPRPYHSVIKSIREDLELFTGYTYEVCFVNLYLNGSDHLGWHSDNSPEMDDARPIASISLGSERDIHFRRIPHVCWSCNGSGRYDNSGSPKCSGCNGTGKEQNDTKRIRLQNGSLCIMLPGMQDEWQHRIPKTGFVCGERISLVFRGYVKLDGEHKKD